MLIELKQKWFAPGPKVAKDKIQSISGRRYNPGVHEVPDELKDFLPKDAKILDKKPEEKPIEEQSHSLSEFDLARTNADATEKMLDDAEAALKKKQDNMAQARAAKGAKKGNKTVE